MIRQDRSLSSWGLDPACFSDFRRRVPSGVILPDPGWSAAEIGVGLWVAKLGSHFCGGPRHAPCTHDEGLECPATPIGCRPEPRQRSAHPDTTRMAPVSTSR
jgi:hypothetical protein